ncbi:MAG TPA: hypothetical protein VMJ32_15745 [Pirellulales bacterium]|nr:hypothetical protein [Pirellulales bacterium]
MKNKLLSALLLLVIVGWLADHVLQTYRNNSYEQSLSELQMQIDVRTAKLHERLDGHGAGPKGT